MLGRGSSSGKDAGGTSPKRQFEPGSPRHKWARRCGNSGEPVSSTSGLGPLVSDRSEYSTYGPEFPFGDPFPQRVGLGPP